MIQDQPHPPSNASPAAGAAVQPVVVTVSEPQLVAFADALSKRVQAGDVIALYGPLGAGKSTFARAFIRAATTRAGDPADEVPSPTFTLVQTYEAASLTLWHFDLYRIGQPDDIWELGVEEAFADGVSLVEWPERAGNLLPVRRLDLLLDHVADPAVRSLKIVDGTGVTGRFDRALQILQSRPGAGA